MISSVSLLDGDSSDPPFLQPDDARSKRLVVLLFEVARSLDHDLATALPRLEGIRNCPFPLDFYLSWMSLLGLPRWRTLPPAAVGEPDRSRTVALASSDFRPMALRAATPLCPSGSEAEGQCRRENARRF
jgi:hypothetical protein